MAPQLLTAQQILDTIAQQLRLDGPELVRRLLQVFSIPPAQGCSEVSVPIERRAISSAAVSNETSV